MASSSLNTSSKVRSSLPVPPGRFLTCSLQEADLPSGAGNILMRSQGRPLIDSVYTLSAGILRLEIDKPTFERMGLEGQVIPSAGRKHVKARYAIELNLRLPSMLHGKKGFERIVWAFRNVLAHTVTWLFHDLDGPNDGTGPLAAHAPVLCAVAPRSEILEHVLVPTVPREPVEEHDAVELLEWLTLALSGAPGVRVSGAPDAHLARYKVPHFDDDSNASLETQDLVKFSYRGFLPGPFIAKILLAALRRSSTEQSSWFAMSAASFDGDAYAILRAQDRIFVWEYMD
nr:hypothetical protein CFP56_62452 [Quercus suber]